MADASLGKARNTAKIVKQGHTSTNAYGQDIHKTKGGAGTSVRDESTK